MAMQIGVENGHSAILGFGAARRRVFADTLRRRLAQGAGSFPQIGQRCQCALGSQLDAPNDFVQLQ